MQSQECSVRQSALKCTMALLHAVVLSLSLPPSPPLSVSWYPVLGPDQNEEPSVPSHSPVIADVVASWAKLQWLHSTDDGCLCLLLKSAFFLFFPCFFLFFVYRHRQDMCHVDMVWRRTHRHPGCSGGSLKTASSVFVIVSPGVERCTYEHVLLDLCIGLLFVYLFTTVVKSQLTWQGSRWLNICSGPHLSLSDVSNFFGTVRGLKFTSVIWERLPVLEFKTCLVDASAHLILVKCVSFYQHMSLHIIDAGPKCLRWLCCHIA